MSRRLSLAMLAGAMPLWAGAATHPFSAGDLVRLARVDEPAASPDGKLVAYVVRETDLEADKGRKDLSGRSGSAQVWKLSLEGP